MSLSCSYTLFNCLFRYLFRTTGDFTVSEKALYPNELIEKCDCIFNRTLELLKSKKIIVHLERASISTIVKFGYKVL